MSTQDNILLLLPTSCTRTVAPRACRRCPTRASGTLWTVRLWETRCLGPCSRWVRLGPPAQKRRDRMRSSGLDKVCLSRTHSVTSTRRHSGGFQKRLPHAAGVHTTGLCSRLVVLGCLQLRIAQRALAACRAANLLPFGVVVFFEVRVLPRFFSRFASRRLLSQSSSSCVLHHTCTSSPSRTYSWR